MNASTRRALVTGLYERGATLEEIGDALNVTRERARQLLDQYGIARRPRADRLYDTAFPTRGEEVEALFLQLREDEAVAVRTGIDVASVRRFVTEHIPDPDVLRRKPRQRSAH